MVNGNLGAPPKKEKAQEQLAGVWGRANKQGMTIYLLNEQMRQNGGVHAPARKNEELSSGTA